MIKVMIQVAAGSCDRRIYNEKSLEYLETRTGTQPYRYPYGFVVGTRAEDGCCVDCYLITNDPVTAGSIVACEVVGLLLQNEDGEIDHKIMAALPGQEVVVGPELLQEMQAFIRDLFAGHPEMKIRVGPILPREAALRHLEESGSA